MIRKLKWFWIGLLLLLLVYLPFQIPWSASVERPILAQLKKDGIDPVPRTASGQIDFVAIVNQSHYASPDENMFVDVLRLMRTETDTNVQMLDILGNPQIEDDPLVTFEDFLRAKYPEFSEDEFEAILNRVEKPWTPNTEPLAAEWLERYGDKVDQVARASHKPKFYCPLVCQDGESTLLSADLGEMMKTRDVARTLTCQLYFHLGNNDLDQAIGNYVAIQKYGLALMDGPFLIDQLIGIAVCGIGYQTLGRLLETDSINDQQLATLKTAVATASSRSAGSGLKVAEKYYALEAIWSISSAGGDDAVAAMNQFGKVDKALESIANLRRVINWETATVECLNWLESAEQSLRIENDFDRLRSLEQWESELEVAGDVLVHMPWMLLNSLAGAGPRGKLAGQILSSRFLGAYSNVESAMIRTRAQFDISQIGTAIESHHLKHGVYPEKLEELVPEFLDAISIDRYTNGLLNYVKTETHYFVCSVGPDQVDSIQKVIQDVGMTADGRVDDTYTLLKVKLKD